MKQLLSLALTLFACSMLHAQVGSTPLGRASGRGVLGNISLNKIAIVNNQNQKLYFKLSFPNNPWSSQEVDAFSNVTYDLKGFDHMYISVATNSQKVEYKLHGGKRYEIKWNDSKSLWDVYSIN